MRWHTMMGMSCATVAPCSASLLPSRGSSGQSSQKLFGGRLRPRRYRGQEGLGLHFLQAGTAWAPDRALCLSSGSGSGSRTS